MYGVGFQKPYSRVQLYKLLDLVKVSKTGKQVKYKPDSAKKVSTLNMTQIEKFEEELQAKCRELLPEVDWVEKWPW